MAYGKGSGQGGGRYNRSLIKQIVLPPTTHRRTNRRGRRVGPNLYDGIEGEFMPSNPPGRFKTRPGMDSKPNPDPDPGDRDLLNSRDTLSPDGGSGKGTQTSPSIYQTRLDKTLDLPGEEGVPEWAKEYYRKGTQFNNENNNPYLSFGDFEGGKGNWNYPGDSKIEWGEFPSLSKESLKYRIDPESMSALGSSFKEQQGEAGEWLKHMDWKDPDSYINLPDTLPTGEGSVGIGETDKILAGKVRGRGLRNDGLPGRRGRSGVNGTDFNRDYGDADQWVDPQIDYQRRRAFLDADDQFEGIRRAKATQGVIQDGNIDRAMGADGKWHNVTGAPTRQIMAGSRGLNEVLEANGIGVPKVEDKEIPAAEKDAEGFKYNETPLGAGGGNVDGVGTLGPNYGIEQDKFSYNKTPFGAGGGSVGGIGTLGPNYGMTRPLW